jgi:hypothetical protein
MYFVELKARLIGVARQRVRNGLNTERGLARDCGISQPHMHNLLKHKRMLSSRSADQLLRGLGLTIPDLLWRPVDGEVPEIRNVPVLRMAIGPGREAPFHIHRSHMPLPVELLNGLVDPVLARLAPDLLLPRTFAPNDLVLLDQNPVLRAAPSGQAYWVVAEGGGLRVRALRTRGARILIGDGIDTEAGAWRVLERRRRRLTDAIRARVVWVGRKLEPVAGAT